jgi:hypothetical protein
VCNISYEHKEAAWKLNNGIKRIYPMLRSDYLKSLPALFAFFLLSCGYPSKKETQLISLANKSVTDCAACERITLFLKSKELISKSVWKGLDAEAHVRPLLYFTDSNTYVAFTNNVVFKKYDHELLGCGTGLSLLKLPRLDTKPFHMENNMNFKDTASLYYNQPMMLCSDVETLIRIVPDFDKTEDWLQLVMHEYFHSFQFSHKPTINHLSETIRMSSDTLNKIYLENAWFQQLLEKENMALLNAIRTNAGDSTNLYIDEFFRTRQQRRMKYKTLHKLNLSELETFWETIEGTARYAEYYMAGNFHQMTTETSNQCDSLFRNFKDYASQSNFENEPAFIQRTKMMQAYYYVTGFNLCRLMDKIGIDYKLDLFDHPTEGLYEILTKNINR